jgi:hypothetical protein
MAKMAPVHPGNGMLHWGDRIEIPNPTESSTEILAVPVTLLRGNGDLVIDRLRQAIINRGTKSSRFRLANLEQDTIPGAPKGAEWTAWVVSEARN